jgi:hypothetical protein
MLSASNISYAPMLTMEGVSVKVADPKSREKCLEGYTFLLEPIQMVIFESFNMSFKHTHTHTHTHSLKYLIL